MDDFKDIVELDDEAEWIPKKEKRQKNPKAGGLTKKKLAKVLQNLEKGRAVRQMNIERKKKGLQPINSKTKAKAKAKVSQSSDDEVESSRMKIAKMPSTDERLHRIELMLKELKMPKSAPINIPNSVSQQQKSYGGAKMDIIKDEFLKLC